MGHLGNNLTLGVYDRADELGHSVRFILLPPDFPLGWVQRWSRQRLVWYYFHRCLEGFLETRLPAN